VKDYNSLRRNKELLIAVILAVLLAGAWIICHAIIIGVFESMPWNR